MEEVLYGLMGHYLYCQCLNICNGLQVQVLRRADSWLRGLQPPPPPQPPRARPRLWT